MKPYYQEKGIVIYHGDCRDVSDLPIVDLIVTDPPYGVNWFSGRGNQGFTKIAGDGGETSPSEFLSYAIRNLRRGRHVYCFGAENFKGLNISGETELIWDKGIGSLGDLSCPFSKSHERILFGTYNLSLSDRKKGGGNLAARLRKKSVLRCDRLHSEAVKLHPTQKPVRLLRELIESSSMIDEIVFDPYMGCGSTLLAAQIEGRKAIGIEIEEKYCEIAAKRLGQEVFDFETPALLKRENKA